MKKFLLHFTSCYGAIWLAMLLYSMITQTSIDAEEFGLYMFPVISAVYGFIKSRQKSTLEIDNEVLQTELSRLRHELSSIEGDN